MFGLGDERIQRYIPKNPYISNLLFIKLTKLFNTLPNSLSMGWRNEANAAAMTGPPELAAELDVDDEDGARGERRRRSRRSSC